MKNLFILLLSLIIITQCFAINPTPIDSIRLDIMQKQIWELQKNTAFTEMEIERIITHPLLTQATMWAWGLTIIGLIIHSDNISPIFYAGAGIFQLTGLLYYEKKDVMIMKEFNP